MVGVPSEKAISKQPAFRVFDYDGESLKPLKDSISFT